MNLNIGDFLSPHEARAWAEYFGKELGYKIGYDFFYDNHIETSFPTVKEDRRINYPFMCNYKFGLTPACKKDIASYIDKRHELKFHLKQKGQSFLYVVKYIPITIEPVPVVTTYQQMTIGEFISL